MIRENHQTFVGIILMVRESTDAHGHKLGVKESMFNRQKPQTCRLRFTLHFPLPPWHMRMHLRNPQETGPWSLRVGDLQSRNDWCSEGPKVSKGLSIVSMTQMLHVWPLVWPINLHQSQQWPSFVGTYSSTMVRIWVVMKTQGFDDTGVGKCP